MKKGLIAFITASLLSSTGMAMAKSPESPKVCGWVETVSYTHLTLPTTLVV